MKIVRLPMDRSDHSPRELTVRWAAGNRDAYMEACLEQIIEKYANSNNLSFLMHLAKLLHDDLVPDGCIKEMDVTESWFPYDERRERK